MVSACFLGNQGFGPFQIVINVICSHSSLFTCLFLLSCHVFNPKPPLKTHTKKQIYGFVAGRCRETPGISRSILGSRAEHWPHGLPDSACSILSWSFLKAVCVRLGEGDAILPLPRCEKFLCDSPDYKSAWHETESELWGQRSAGCKGKYA